MESDRTVLRPTMVCYTALLDAESMSTPVNMIHVRRLYGVITKEWRPNLYIFNTLTKAHARCGDLSNIETIMKTDMKHYNVSMDQISYGTVLNTYATKGEKEKAIELLTQLECDDSLRPNIVMYNTVLKCLSVQEG